MSENSAIEWTDNSFNPWWGCVRISPACRFCYADTTASRYGYQLWRAKGERRMLSDANWRKPLQWNRDAETAGERKRVFCASMADVFEGRADLDAPRARLWELIGQTPWLDWQLLTKRPENVTSMVPWGDDWPPNVWLGVSAENHQFAEQRLPVLSEIPAKVRFVSAEPLLGWLNIADFLGADYRAISWVIIGGESGAKARETRLPWIESVVDQCNLTGAAPFVKQLGTHWAKANGERGKGGDWSTWPEDLRIREFPRTAVAS